MMKKALILIMLVLLSSFSIAYAETNVSEDIDDNTPLNETDDDLQEDEDDDTSLNETEYEEELDEDEDEENTSQVGRPRLRSRLTEAQKEMLNERIEEIKERDQEIREEAKERAEERHEVIMSNRDEMKEALDALKEIGNFTGADVREIVQEYNAELKETLEAEDLIKQRSRFARFFVGGNEKAAKRLENQIERNEEKIESLKKRLSGIDDEEIESLIEEHIGRLEQNQERLQKVSSNEKKSKGIFGWIWK